MDFDELADTSSSKAGTSAVDRAADGDNFSDAAGEQRADSLSLNTKPSADDSADRNHFSGEAGEQQSDTLSSSIRTIVEAHSSEKENGHLNITKLVDADGKKSQFPIQ